MDKSEEEYQQEIAEIKERIRKLKLGITRDITILVFLIAFLICLFLFRESFDTFFIELLK